MKPDGILREVSSYYSARLREHGSTPRGVDWNSAESQQLRFRQLTRLFEGASRVELLDYGCGYGALLDFLLGAGVEVGYAGFDVAEQMVATARERHAGADRVRFSSDAASLVPVEYVVASGVFNVKLGFAADEWQRYVLNTLDDMARLGARGFAFNMLTIYSDPERMRSNLYYGDPSFYFDHCMRSYGRKVALLHDYELFEFTILVRT